MLKVMRDFKAQLVPVSLLNNTLSSLYPMNIFQQLDNLTSALSTSVNLTAFNNMVCYYRTMLTF